VSTQLFLSVLALKTFTCSLKTVGNVLQLIDRGVVFLGLDMLQVRLLLRLELVAPLF